MLFASSAEHFTQNACKVYNPKVCHSVMPIRHNCHVPQILPCLVSWVVKLFVTFMNKLQKAYDGTQIFHTV